jgi:hypothetical protein
VSGGAGGVDGSLVTCRNKAHLEDVGTSDLIGSEWYVLNTNFFELLLKTYLLRAQNAIKKLYKLSAGRLKADLAVHVTSIKGLFSRLRIHLTPPDRGPHRTWGDRDCKQSTDQIIIQLMMRCKL